MKCVAGVMKDIAKKTCVFLIILLGTLSCFLVYSKCTNNILRFKIGSAECSVNFAEGEFSSPYPNWKLYRWGPFFVCKPE
jgi:hypothetical protein